MFAQLSYFMLLVFLFIFTAHSGLLLAWEIPHPVYQADTDISPDAVAEYMSMTESTLRSLITEKGARRGTNNAKLKQVVYDIARLYQKTGDSEYADKAVILLERYAEVVPKWPLISRRDSGDRRKGDSIPLDEVDWSSWDCSGLWGGWYCTYLMRCKELVLAYDFVAGSGALERRSEEVKRDVRQLIENDLLRYMADLSLRFGENKFSVGNIKGEDWSYGNMGGHGIIGLVPFGRVVEPAYIHIAVPRLRNYPRVSYFRDGIWHESSPSYHRQITGRLSQAISLLSGYSDPAGYKYDGYTTRFDKKFQGDGTCYDNLNVEAGMESQFRRTRQALEHLILPNGEYLAVHEAHAYESTHPRKKSGSYCYFGMRHAVLGRFSGNNQVQAHLHFGGADGHEHRDCLNLVLWALEGELLSEGEYKNYGNGGWNASAAGHNTVVVDEANQKYRLQDHFQLTEDDAVDGVGFYRYQNYGHGSTKHFGNLRFWDPTHPNVQVVEAEGENAYGKDKVSLYRRTIVMVEIEGTDFYLIDIFRVKGGNLHDWMLHGRLNEDYGFWTNLTLNPASGKRFGYLNLQKKVLTNSTWSSEFICGSGARIRTTMLGCPDTEVSIGRAPAMRRTGEATFLDVRREGSDNLFVCVHEPYTGTPKVKRITPIQYTGKADAAVSFKVELDGGRTDYFAATLDQPPYPEHSFPEVDLKFKGRLVHIAKQDSALLWMYLLEGTSISMDGIELSAVKGDCSYRGLITDIKRIEKGDGWDGFITDTDLPTDGRLNNKTLLLTLPDGRTEGYTISRIEKKGGISWIYVHEEPGIELRDNGKLVKLVYYPWHGLRGDDIHFLIPGSIYRNAKGNIESTALIAK